MLPAIMGARRGGGQEWAVAPPPGKKLYGGFSATFFLLMEGHFRHMGDFCNFFLMGDLFHMWETFLSLWGAFFGHAPPPSYKNFSGCPCPRSPHPFISTTGVNARFLMGTYLQCVIVIFTKNSNWGRDGDMHYMHYFVVLVSAFLIQVNL